MAEPAPRRPTGGPRLAYVMSRFPKLTETFVLYEILAVEQQGASVDLYPLLREREATMHPEAGPLVARARYLPFLSRDIAASQLWFLAHRPKRYLGTIWRALSGTIRSPNFFLGTLGILPKTAHAARLMQRDGIEHVHCHFANHPAMAGYIIDRLTGIPFSFTAHGSDLHVDRTFLPAKVDAAAFVVAISEDNRREILETCPAADPERVHVVHCGVDTSTFEPEARVPSSDGSLRIASIGTLHEVKGQAVLVEACRILAERGIAFDCRLVGEGPDRAMLEARIEAAGLGDRVQLVGRKTRGELVEVLRSSDVLAAPSVPTRGGKREGIPVVLMEAMASGLPVVASRLSGIPELVEDGRSGILVTSGDAVALADALASLGADPARRASMGAAARERVLAAFDLGANAASILDLIERSLRPAAGHRAPAFAAEEGR
jgi:colanic acid/amylovoran biosynthesis glycosyltransferase